MTRDKLCMNAPTPADEKSRQGFRPGGFAKSKKALKLYAVSP
jgi:hypothetical protein